MEKATSQVLCLIQNIKLPAASSKDMSLVAGTVVGTIAAVQLLTEWDPVGRCLTFWRQLRNHVSCPTENLDQC